MEVETLTPPTQEVLVAPSSPSTEEERESNPPSPSEPKTSVTSLAVVAPVDKPIENSVAVEVKPADLVAAHMEDVKPAENPVVSAPIEPEKPANVVVAPIEDVNMPTVAETAVKSENREEEETGKHALDEKEEEPPAKAPRVEAQPADLVHETATAADNMQE